jgi:hypothetical protein
MQSLAVTNLGMSSLWRAAERLGIGIQAGTPAVEVGMIEFDGRVRFRHPLTRSAAYRSASLAERQQLHAALAEVTDPLQDPDRRAWHTPRPTTMKRWPSSSNALQAARRPAAAWQRRPRSSNARRC